MFLETKKSSTSQKEPFPILKQKYKDKTTNRGKAGKSTMKLVTNTVTFIIKGLPLFVVYGSCKEGNSFLNELRGKTATARTRADPRAMDTSSHSIHHSTHK